MTGTFILIGICVRRTAVSYFGFSGQSVGRPPHDVPTYAAKYFPLQRLIRTGGIRSATGSCGKHFLYRVKILFCEDSVVLVFADDPILFVHRSVAPMSNPHSFPFPINDRADVPLIPQYLPNITGCPEIVLADTRPFTVDPCVVLIPHGRHYALTVKRKGNFCTAMSIQCHLENPLHYFRGRLVDDKVVFVILVFYIAKGSIRTKKQSLFGALCPCGLDLLRKLTAI